MPYAFIGQLEADAWGNSLIFFAGTVSYCSPELLKQGKLTKAADVYSFAMMMWEMYSGTALFRGMNSSQASLQVHLECLNSLVIALYYNQSFKTWRERRANTLFAASSSSLHM